VRESIAELINAGVLHRAVGKGTFVAERVEVERPAKHRRSIAFLISEDIFHFVETGYNRILAGVEEFCRNQGYYLVFHTLNENGHSNSLGGLLGEEPSSLDGCVVTGGVREHTLEQITKASLPLVIVDLLIAEDAPDMTTVRIDYETGTRLAIEHLAALGHRDIGFIGFPGSDKYRAYWESLEQFALPYNPRNVDFLQLVDLKPGILAGYQAMQKMITHGSHPTAILVTNDLVALGVLEALAVAGISVPDEVSVVGFDDIGRVTNPPLTTIRVDLSPVKLRRGLVEGYGRGVGWNQHTRRVYTYHWSW
jgi:LacI family transcriptional regulator